MTRSSVLRTKLLPRFIEGGFWALTLITKELINGKRGSILMPPSTIGNKLFQFVCFAASCSGIQKLPKWLAMLTAVPLGLGSYPGEDMDVCNCIVPERHGGTLNSRRAASPLVRLVEREERWEASDHPQSVLPLNWGRIEPNRTVTLMVLKATANDRRHLALCHDEFRGP
ncbi:uncharacterized protein TNCV_2879621 [Trichonephila clavipes]|uniref:Uncharacterized protein n=1 Tax=Trichonephila clavipes TaxID=2585209 RepID=A0A8X6W202_TRICX|nr:uncharacterized protein TNCV_2879621 [Trichonephila clavipes]